jgi:rubrerythrin
MASSHQWRRYYELNARSLLSVPWEIGPELSADERWAITKSLQEFQAGESSEGRHLFRYAQQYVERTGDSEYVPTIRLFIAEEQRHARDLGRFLTLNDIDLVRTTFTDSVFRKLRNVFAGLEISIAVLITAEIIAKIYYAVLREATESKILRRLCDQILSDERRHVEFQAEQLAKLRAGRGWLGRKLTMGLQRFLFFGTVIVVWLLHRRVIRRGGLSPVGWWRALWREFNEAFPRQPLKINLDDVVPPESEPAVAANATDDAS